MLVILDLHVRRECVCIQVFMYFSISYKMLIEVSIVQDEEMPEDNLIGQDVIIVGTGKTAGINSW